MNSSKAIRSTSRVRSPEEATQLFFALCTVLIPVLVRGMIWWPAALAPLLFGIGHYGGVPNGLLGCAMATAYRIGLGLMRQRAQGVGACIFSHVVVDFTIYAMLAWSL